MIPVYDPTRLDLPWVVTKMCDKPKYNVTYRFATYDQACRAQTDSWPTKLR